MPIYDRSAKDLMRDFARELKTNEVFNKKKAIRWFSEHYPKINSHTIDLHVSFMSVNQPRRRNFANVRPDSGHDLFFWEGEDKYRLWDPTIDPAPKYKADFLSDSFLESDNEPDLIETVNDSEAVTSEAMNAAFAYEEHLKEYLARNLEVLEHGLKLYDEEGITGIEFPVGGRRIDILAIDKTGSLVVIELKVSRGYDRVIGQLLRYMSWIEQNLASGKKVRGIIVANEISDDLRMATSRIGDVVLFEYEINFKLKVVT